MDAETLEFPGGFNVYGSGKRISGNRTTSKHWKHTVTIIMGLRASSSRLFLPQAPHTPSKVTACISPGDMCPPTHTHPDTRHQTPELIHQALKPVPGHKLPGPPVSGLLPTMEAEHSPLATGSAATAGPKRINEANFDLAPSYGT